MHASKVDGAKLRRLHQTGAMQIAATVARKVAVANRGLSPNDVLALALHLHPEDAPADALVRLDATVDNFIRSFSAVSSELRDTLAADRERMAPVVAKAARRRLQIVSELGAIGSHIRSIERHDLAKRERLTSAGLSDAELQAVAAATDTTKLSARRAALNAEGEALERFLSTYDERDLPAGFAEGETA